MVEQVLHEGRELKRVEDGEISEPTTPLINTIREKVIRRTKDRSLVTKTQEKRQKVVARKRKLLPDLNTLPYGFKKPRYSSSSSSV